MLDRISQPQDFDLVEACLEGSNSALAELQSRYWSPLYGFLLIKGANPEEAREVLETLWTDCCVGLGGRRPKLAKYSGRSPLSTWLHTVAFREFISYRREDISGQPLDPETPDRVVNQPDEPLAQLLLDALQGALATCSAEDYVLLQLAHRQNVPQKVLCTMWGFTAPQMSKRLRSICDGIRSRVMEHVRRWDPHLDLTWEDYVQFCGVISPHWLSDDG